MMSHRCSPFQFGAGKVWNPGLCLSLLNPFYVVHRVHPPLLRVVADIKKDQPKVVDSFTLTEIEDLVKENKAGTVALCRCWRSTKFPFCDGSHNKFNETCGDNTGPLLIKKG